MCKFNLEQICIYRSGLPVTDSPIKTTDEKRLCFNTMSDYIENSRGIKLSEYRRRFIMISLAFSRGRMIIFTLNITIVHFQCFQLPCQVKNKFSLLARKRALFSSIRLGKFRKILFWQTDWWRRNKQPGSKTSCGDFIADNFTLKIITELIFYRECIQRWFYWITLDTFL